MSARDNGGPAFPCAEASQNNSTGETTVHQWGRPGVTMRDYFAARAPLEIPAWFQGPESRVLIRPLPGDRIVPWVENWLRDPCYDLADVVEDDARDEAIAFEALMREFWAAQTRVKQEREIARYFAWRWHYADQMLAAGAAEPQQ